MPEPARRTVLRTVILYIAIFGIASLALGEGAYLYARHELSRRLELRMAERMDMLGQTYTAGGKAGLLNAIEQFTGRGARTFGYVLTDATGRRLRRLGDVPRLAPGWGMIGFEDDDQGRRMCVFFERGNQTEFDSLVKFFETGAPQPVK